MKRILTLMRRWGHSAGGWASVLALPALLLGLAGALGWWGESPPYPALASRIEDATGGVLSYWSAIGLAGALGMLARLAWKWARGRPSLDGAEILWGVIGGAGGVLLILLANFHEGRAERATIRARDAPATVAPAPMPATPAIRARDVPTTAIDEPRGYGIGIVHLADGRIQVALERARAQNEYTLSAYIARLYDALDAYVEAHHLMADTTWMPFPPPPLPALRLTRLFDAGDELTGAWDALFQYGLVSPGTGGQSGCLDSLLEVTYATLPMLPPTNPILYRFYTYYDFELARLAEFDEDAREARERTADALLTCTRALGGGA